MSVSGSVSGVTFAPAVVDTSHEYFHLFDIYVPIALGVFAIITVLAVYAVVRGRRRPLDRAARWNEHHVLEGSYAVVLAAIVAFLLYETFTTEHTVDTVANRQKPAVTIDVVGSRWEWTFEYPRYGIAVHSGSSGDSTFVVPAGEPVAFYLSTTDVIHGFWIPALHYKHDNIPGSAQLATLSFAHTGVYAGQCTVYCGLNHSEMVFHIRAVSPTRFTAWVQQRRKGGSLSTTTAALPSPTRLTGWIGSLTSLDHKKQGVNLFVASFAFFLLGGVMALLMRAQIAQPNEAFLTNQAYDELFTMHGSTMIYLFVSPMALALGLYLVPLQIGAFSLSLPRLSLAGFWTWVSGGLVMQSGWFANGGPGQNGWFDYAPLNNNTYSPGIGQTLWNIGVILATAGQVAIAISLLVTISRRRAPGMSMLRCSMFTWPELVSVLMVIGAYPVLILAMVLVLIDRSGGRDVHGLHRCDRLPEPVLVLRPPGGVRDVLPLLGRCRGGGSGELAQAMVRVQRLRARDPGLRRAVDGGVVTPHVHHRRGDQRVLRLHFDAARHPGGHRILRLHRDDDRRLASCCARRCCSRSSSSSSS